MKLIEDNVESRAWKYMDQRQPAKALNVWNELIARAEGEGRDNLESNSCYALIALNRIEEARSIYLRLYDKHRNHRYAHQLCMVEREAGGYEKALEWLNIEKQLIDTDDILSIAANTYEYGKINELMGNYNQAEKYAEECMSLSLKQSDLIMLACANRLLGDVRRHSNTDEALIYYSQAKKIFFDAGDSVGAEEVDDRMAELTHVTVEESEKGTNHHD